MANVTPGYTFTGTTDPITAAKLNLLGQPTVTIGSGEVVTSMIASGNTYSNVYIGQATPLYESYSEVTFSGTISLTFTATDGNTRRIACTSSTASTISTTSVPRAGFMLQITFTTDGTGGNVITFSTGFKTTGTYTLTGTNKYFQIAFVSDGTNLLEMSRTAAVG
jgi:hypothetical protein